MSLRAFLSIKQFFARVNGRRYERKIPKTELLVTFEVVARHESYTRAAEELALTQSAVFRQVTALEDSSIRHYLIMLKKGFLNAAGKHYLTIVKETLNKLERDTNSIMTWQPTVQVLELAVNPTFSTHWLIPNLREFNKLHPGIIVNIHSLANIGDFLSQSTMPPLCARIFARRGRRLSICSKRKFCRCAAAGCCRTRAKLAVELLSEFPLLHQSTRIHGWQEWFALSNITSPQINIGPRFDLLSMLIAAVRSNLGWRCCRVCHSA
jgi:DNA-binding transcriptional LysR family regulator